MNIRHAAALALVGWYLMTPPMVMPNRVTTWITYDTTAPPSKWDHIGSLDETADCEAARKALLEKYKKDTSIVVPKGMSKQDIQLSVGARNLERSSR